MEEEIKIRDFIYRGPFHNVAKFVPEVSARRLRISSSAWFACNPTTTTTTSSHPFSRRTISTSKTSLTQSCRKSSPSKSSGSKSNCLNYLEWGQRRNQCDAVCHRPLSSTTSILSVGRGCSGGGGQRQRLRDVMSLDNGL